MAFDAAEFIEQDETALWQGRPSGRPVSSFFKVILFTFLTMLVLFLLRGPTDVAETGAIPIFIAACFVSIFWILILGSQVADRWDTHYILTNRRAIIVRRSNRFKARSLPIDPALEITVIGKPAGSILFATNQDMWSREGDANQDERTDPHSRFGFYDIQDVLDVYALLRSIQRDKTGVQNDERRRNNDLSDYLDQDESIIWNGKPEKAIYATPTAMLSHIPTYLVFAFVIATAFGSSDSQWQYSLTYWSVMFAIFFGVPMSWNLFRDIRFRRMAHYYLTNRRAIILLAKKRMIFRSLPITRQTNAQQSWNNRNSILLGPSRNIPSWARFFVFKNDNRLEHPFAFEGLREAEKILLLVKQQVNQSDID